MQVSKSAVTRLQNWCGKTITVLAVYSTLSGFGCYGNSFTGSNKKEVNAPAKSMLSDSRKESSCDVESLEWTCNSKETSCSTKLPVPNTSNWNCKWSKKKYSCEAADLETKPVTCNDSQWKCRDGTSATWSCSLGTVPVPNNDVGTAANWTCTPNSKTDKLSCKKIELEDEENEEQEEEESNETDPESPATNKSPAKTTSPDSTNTAAACKDFDLSGNWSGPWTATTARGGSGTYSLTFTQTPDGKLSGPFKITGTPCAGADSGTITGSFNSDCSIEFMTDVGGGSIGNDQRGFCKFAWKGKIDPATKTGEGVWNAGADIAGTWQTKKQ